MRAIWFILKLPLKILMAPVILSPVSYTHLTLPTKLEV